MKREQPEILDLLAAEFVLGTLVGSARARFERWRAKDLFIARRVRAWEERLARLVLRLAPIAPSPGVWAAIERRLDAEQPSRWRALAAAVAAVAVVGIGWYVWQELRPPQAQAVIAAEGGPVLWKIEVAADGETMDVSATASARVPDQRSLELWALPAEAAPVSLGLMPATGTVRLALDARQLAALGRAANVAISEEPVGGSPTGAPTGPVLFIAPIART